MIIGLCRDSITFFSLQDLLDHYSSKNPGRQRLYCCSQVPFLPQSPPLRKTCLLRRGSTDAGLLRGVFLRCALISLVLWGRFNSQNKANQTGIASWIGCERGSTGHRGRSDLPSNQCRNYYICSVSTF